MQGLCTTHVVTLLEKTFSIYFDIELPSVKENNHKTLAPPPTLAKLGQNI